MYVSAETIINPSEEPSRVIKCLINTINGGSPEINEEGNLAMVKTEGLHALHHIRVGVKSRFSAGVSEDYLNIIVAITKLGFY